MKKILLAMLLLVGGSIATACSLNQADLVNTERINSDNLEHIHISYASDTIRIFENDSSEVVVEEFLNSSQEKSKALIEQENTQLTIQNGQRNHWLPFLKQNNHVDIHLPKGFQGVLSLRTNSGSVKIEDELDLKTLETEQNSGNLKINTATAKELSFKTNSGSIKGENLKASTIKASTNSGSIKLGNLTGSSELETTSGSIKASFTSVKDYVTVKSTSGSVQLDLPKNLSFDFNGKTNSGSLNSDFDINFSNSKKTVNRSVGQGEKKAINIQTNSGSIDLLKH